MAEGRKKTIITIVVIAVIAAVALAVFFAVHHGVSSSPMAQFQQAMKAEEYRQAEYIYNHDLSREEMQEARAWVQEHMPWADVHLPILLDSKH